MLKYINFFFQKIMFFKKIKVLKALQMKLMNLFEKLN